MKKTIYLLTFLVTATITAMAQGPVAYMNAVMADQRKISEDYLAYNSSIAHGKSARKVEKTRAELLASVRLAVRNVAKLSDYEGDVSLKNAVAEYLDLTYKVLNDDYAKIVDMEEISEQSYDNMEAYMTAMDMVDKKMEEASAKMQDAYEAFAKKNEVTIVDSEDDLDKKMKKTSEVNAYYNKAFLIFFKSYKQQMYLMAALQEQKAGNIEQSRGQLEKDVKKSTDDMTALGAFNGDLSLVNAGKKLFEFYQRQCTEFVPVMLDYYMKNERFQEQKKNFDAIKNRTQKDVDEFNAAVNDLNAAVNKSNKASQEMNTLGAKLNNDWNNAVTAFMNKHMPRSK